MSAQRQLPCPPELWPEFSALLDEALDLTDAERPAWLEGLGPEFASVVPWLRKVLSGSSQSLDTGFMSTVVVDHDLPEFSVGQQVGPYVLKQRLGTGGMGEVWLASRSDGSLNRQVALKLPHTHLLAGVIKRRFERERDILAALSHPHIAQLYDAGVADAQHPYLAMEWVDGTSILEHCVDQRLSLDRRLDLFLQILEAVGYAHGRLIAHRDLKPSNILVTRDGQVKLLDFGIAKLLNPDAERGATQLTKMGNCMATPAYAAPEQLAGEPITVSADLYALGVLLHELLTGRRPYRDNRRASPDRTEPGRASSRIEEGHAPTVGGIDTQKLRRALLGDLDAIIAKALEVDPANRYSTAEAFAMDLKRSRENRPITARRISAGMLTLKFVRRHRVGVAMSAVLLLTLVGASGLVAWQAVRAEREAQRATTIKDFLIGVFRASDPRIASDKPRGEITARELLDVSSKQIESAFTTQQGTQVELLGVIAEIYGELNETKRSSSLYERESALASKLPGVGDGQVIDGLIGRAYNAETAGDDAKALAILDVADPLILRAHLDKTALRARWLTIRAEALWPNVGKNDEVLVDLEKAVSLFESVAPTDTQYPVALGDLGALQLERGNYQAAAGHYQKAVSTSLPEGSLPQLMVVQDNLVPFRVSDRNGCSVVHQTNVDSHRMGVPRETYLFWSELRVNTVCQVLLTFNPTSNTIRELSPVFSHEGVWVSVVLGFVIARCYGRIDFPRGCLYGQQVFGPRLTTHSHLKKLVKLASSVERARNHDDPSFCVRIIPIYGSPSSGIFGRKGSGRGHHSIVDVLR